MFPRITHPLHLDRSRRRVWILGQRCHHGALGALLVGLGAALMAHDRKDLVLWFRAGWQEP
jgi:acyl dehydratase